MAFPALIAAFDLASPGLLVAVLVNLTVGLLAGWMLARGRVSHWFGHWDNPTSGKVREWATILSGRVDHHVLRMQELRRDVTRLELTSDRQSQQVLQAIEKKIQPLEDELKRAARQLRDDVRQRRFSLSEVQRTTTAVSETARAGRADLKNLSRDLTHDLTGDKRLAETVRALEEAIRTLEELLTSANTELAALAPGAPTGVCPDTNEQKSVAGSPLAQTRDARGLEDGNRSDERPVDSDLQRIRTLTRQVADQRASVDREHRADRRWNLAIPVVAVPLDDSQQPVGEPASMVTRDISTSGISLLHTQPVPTRFLRVQLDAPILQSTELIVRVVRQRTIGAYTEIAGEFVARFDANEPSAVCEEALSDQRSAPLAAKPASG